MTQPVMEDMSPPPILVTVHALGKFEFCPRAGVLAHEQKDEEKDDEEAGTPRLDYLPQFGSELISEALKATKMPLLQSVIIFAIGLLVVWWFFGRGYVMVSVLLAAVVLVLARKAFIHFQEWRELNRRIDQVNEADVSTSVNFGEEPVMVSWWSLLKRTDCNAEPQVNELHHPELRLSGKPVRVIDCQGHRIPVILHHKELERPKPYHKVRLAAYALLIEYGIVKGESVKWGMILNPQTMKGIVVPVDAEAKQRATSTLAKFQRTLTQVENRADPLPPPEQFCQNCPYGRPRRRRRGMLKALLGGKPVDTKAVKASDRHNYHSPCGDRFDWVPPHLDAVERGLR